MSEDNPDLDDSFEKKVNNKMKKIIDPEAKEESPDSGELIKKKKTTFDV